MADSKVWEWAGVSFGEFDTMLLQKSMKNLLAKSRASEMRFWGKVKGTEYDYYVAQGKLDSVGEEEEFVGGDVRGTGVNEYVYWVTNSPLEEWVQLADLKPDQILAARKIKILFSGDPKRKIFTNPFYDQPESVLLRAQIARINASTSIVPAGLYKFAEDSTREIEDNTLEEGQTNEPQTKQQVNINNWVHYSPAILNQGRFKHADPKVLPGDEDLEPELIQAREVAKDPWEPRLKPISDDEHTRGGMPAWVLRSYDTDQDQINLRTGAKTLNYGTVVLRS